MNFRHFFKINCLRLGFSLGCMLSVLLPENYFWSALTYVTCTLLALRLPKLALFGAIFGLLTGSIHFLVNQYGPNLDGCLNKSIAFSGYVADFPRDLIGRRSEVISLITLDSVRSTEPQCSHIGKISALLIHQGDATANVSLGDVVKGIARFSTTDHQWVFGRFPNNLKGLNEGVRGRLIIRQISDIDIEQRSMLSRLRSRLNDNLSEWSTTDRTARFLQALLLGRQDRLLEGDWHQLKALGISHALVVSGLHVGLVTLWIGALVSLPRRLLALTPTIRNNLIERIIVCAGSYAYVAITGMSLPAERAFLMITFATLARPLIWSVHPMAVISLVAALLLIKNPFSGLTASFRGKFTCDYR